MLSEGWGTPPPCYAASTPNTKGVHKTLALNATEPAQEVAGGGLAIHLRIHEISQQKQDTGNRDPEPVWLTCYS